LTNITSTYRQINETYQALREHVDQYLPNSEKKELYWEEKQIKNLLPRWSVLEIPPRKDVIFWTYLTQGVWETTKDEVYPQGRYGYEFIIFSHEKSLVHIETLAWVTCYHANPAHRLKQGSVVDIGRSWLDKSSCDHLMVSLPYPIAYDFETLKINDLYISFRWLVPITQSEASIARLYGQELLERKFEEAGVDYLNPRRKSLV
jgi:hypothetical protein